MEELSIQQLKKIKRYQMKKYRQQDRVFLVEGYKLVNEMLSSNIIVKSIIISADWETKPLQAKQNLPIYRLHSTKFSQVSSQKNPEGILAVCEQPEPQPIDETQWILALDDIRDPGNLGTIIRIADYFGLKDIVCSLGTVDCYNPKVIQSTMGSIARVTIHYVDLETFIQQSDLPIYAATLDGESVSDNKVEQGVLVIGSESHGISNNILSLANKKLTIARKGNAESLNAAVATGILLYRLIS